MSRSLRYMYEIRSLVEKSDEINVHAKHCSYDRIRQTSVRRNLKEKFISLTSITKYKGKYILFCYIIMSFKIVKIISISITIYFNVTIFMRTNMLFIFENICILLCTVKMNTIKVEYLKLNHCTFGNGRITCSDVLILNFVYN